MLLLNTPHESVEIDLVLDPLKSAGQERNLLTRITYMMRDTIVNEVRSTISREVSWHLNIIAQEIGGFSY